MLTVLHPTYSSATTFHSASLPASSRPLPILPNQLFCIVSVKFNKWQRTLRDCQAISITITHLIFAPPFAVPQSTNPQGCPVGLYLQGCSRATFWGQVLEYQFVIFQELIHEPCASIAVLTPPLHAPSLEHSFLRPSSPCPTLVSARAPVRRHQRRQDRIANRIIRDRSIYCYLLAKLYASPPSLTTSSRGSRPSPVSMRIC